jgi:hypothetical protein
MCSQDARYHRTVGSKTRHKSYFQAANDLTNRSLPLIRGFHESAEIALSGRQNAENDLTRS